MTTTQRPRPQRASTPPPNSASRGLIIVAVAVVLGAILLIKGGGVGFERNANDLTIDPGTEASAPVDTTTTTMPVTVTSVPPAALKVVALNGAGVNGYAGQAQQFLSIAGYTSTTAATAATPSETTIVYYAPGFEADAQSIATLFGLDPSAAQPFPEGTELATDSADLPLDTNIAIVLGPDVANTVESATGAATATPGSADDTGGAAATAGNSATSPGGATDTTVPAGAN